MDPEMVLVIVTFALFGVIVWLAGVPAGWARFHHGPPEAERAAWWRLVLPPFAGLLVFSFLVGWALQESDPTDEHVTHVLAVMALVSGGVLLRAVVRAVQSLRSSAEARVPIGTLGLFSPRVFVSEEFQKNVSTDALRAALAHEAAHKRGRDPLRIWLAQLAADLQWPVPGTKRRFSAWLLALEAKRDDEALAAGVTGEDLAEAILSAARLHSRSSMVCAHVAGSGAGIAWRVRRLLSSAHREPRRRPTVRLMVPVWCTGLLLTAAWLGLHHGEAFLGLLLGKGP